MPREKQITKNTPPISRYDPSALVDLHPAPSRKDVPVTIPLPLRVIFALCPLRRRKDSWHLPSKTVSSSTSIESVSRMPSSCAHASSYTSFPPPTFHHNGQPRALDTRQYSDSTASPKVAVQGQKQQRGQLTEEEEARTKQAETANIDVSMRTTS